MKTLSEQIKQVKSQIKQHAPAKPVVEMAEVAPEEDLFKHAVKDARPLAKPKRIHHPPLRPKPIPKQFLLDEQQALADSLSDHFIPTHELETGEELLYLRDGHSPDILSKLRRGYWVIQAAIDLHGMVSDEARLYVSTFIHDCKSAGCAVCE